MDFSGNLFQEYENPDYPFEWGEAKRGQDFIKSKCQKRGSILQTMTNHLCHHTFEIAIISSDDEVSSSVSEDMIRNLNNTALLGLLVKFISKLYITSCGPVPPCVS